MGLTPLCASQGFHHFSGCERELIKNVFFFTFLVAEGRKQGKKFPES